MATSPRRQDNIAAKVGNNTMVPSHSGPPGPDDESGIEPLDRASNARRGEMPIDMMGRLSLQENQRKGDDEDDMINNVDSSEAQSPEARLSGAAGVATGTEGRKLPPNVQALAPYNNPNTFNTLPMPGAMGASKALSSATKQAAQQPGNMKDRQRQHFDSNEGEDEEFPEEDDDEQEESGISGSEEDGSWIAWFCSLRGNEFFCEVDEDYIQDDFNLTGLSTMVPYYEYALDMVLDVEMPMEDSLTEEQQEIMESAAEMLYGLIHARYIITNRGMHNMYEKYRSAHFGRCPAVFCQGQPVLPVGLSDLPRNFTVNVFCPRCHGLYFPKSTRQANIDGAYFGTTFPHLYLMTHPDMVPQKPTQIYQPRVYGFRVNEQSLYYRNRDDEKNSSQRLETSLRSNRRTKRQTSANAANRR